MVVKKIQKGVIHAIRDSFTKQRKRNPSDELMEILKKGPAIEKPVEDARRIAVPPERPLEP